MRKVFSQEDKLWQTQYELLSSDHHIEMILPAISFSILICHKGEAITEQNST